MLITDVLSKNPDLLSTMSEVIALSVLRIRIGMDLHFFDKDPDQHSYSDPDFDQFLQPTFSQRKIVSTFFT